MPEYIYLSEHLSLPIKQLVRSSALAYAVYTMANRERWSVEKFLEELALAFGKAHGDLQAAELQRQMMMSPAPPLRDETGVRVHGDDVIQRYMVPQLPGGSNG